MIIFLFWIGFAVIVGIAANHRGRNGVGWGLLAALISPLLAGLLLFVLPRRNALSDIATLAMIEATPEGSRSRQLLADHEAKIARIKEEKDASSAWLLGLNSNRPWSPSATSTRSSFIFAMTVWAGLLLFVGIILVIHKSKPHDISAVAAPIAHPVKQLTSAEKSREDCSALFGTVLGGGWRAVERLCK